jgi:N-methylhydantoinase A
MTPDGPLRKLTPQEISRVIDAVAEMAPEAIAICLLHSYRHPEHERRLGEELHRRFPTTHISLSHETVGTFREYERGATTEIDAALSPLLGRYLRKLGEQSHQRRLPEPTVMQSSGGLTSIARASEHASVAVLSGPAGGAAGALWAAKVAGVKDALCFDMGGTSCDVCVISDETVRETSAGVIAGRPIALPTLDVETVGAGGGSIAWRDAGGALQVGPRSAGASPGPAAYGFGNSEPTVTDANLVLGYLPEKANLGGEIRLNAELARTAVGGLARKLGLSDIACAEGIRRVANAEMLRALRVMTVQRGLDPRGMALLSFGGAGPLHAAAIAEELGISTVICPFSSGVLAALGLIVGERRSDAQRSVLLTGSELNDYAVRQVIDELADTARLEIENPTADLSVTCELRYRGQSFELPIQTTTRPEIDRLRQDFAKSHRQAYGYDDTEGEVELVTIRVTAKEPGAELKETFRDSGELVRTDRQAVFFGEAVNTTVVSGTPQPGDSVPEMTIIELQHTTVLVPPGWTAKTGEGSFLTVSRDQT